MHTKFNINLSKAFLLFLSVVIELLLYSKIKAVGDKKKKALNLVPTLKEHREVSKNQILL